ncbi:Ankyrin repeat domain-containing protein 60 [Myotis brandtii]|uniref:Ankyrin repeat domain-containing protein 60 n=1 Tax=Myotis brandtii TaxID=109478 RepID=S7Q0E4_MYOBR|nr:Ankyrin repeat domain-containing protein 60 [Myotis brandtii]
MNMALDLAPDVFIMRVLLEETGEMFTVTDCHGDMTVQELKEKLDLAAGIPLNLQLLQYLDQGGPFSTPPEPCLLPGPRGPVPSEPADPKGKQPSEDPQLSCLGVSEDSPYRTPTLQYLGEKQRKKWIAQRAFVALYIASHRGHVEAVQYLLEQGASCLSRSPMGRTPLHVATFMGHSDCIGLLLQHGASVYAKDAKGMTPRDIAHQLNRRQDEQQMFLSTQLPKPGAKGPKT